MNLNFGQCVDGYFFFTSFEHSLCFWLASFQSTIVLNSTIRRRYTALFTTGQQEEDEEEKKKTTEANVNVKTLKAHIGEKDHKMTTTNRLKPAFLQIESPQRQQSRGLANEETLARLLAWCCDEMMITMMKKKKKEEERKKERKPVSMVQQCM